MIVFSRPNANIFVPDARFSRSALARTTLMGVGAHQDDLEFMAYYPILKAFTDENEWFTGVVVTNGASSVRNGTYRNFTDEEMIELRRIEQQEAAVIGKYAAAIQLDHTSADVKDPANTSVVDDLEQILVHAKPREVYTHNLADKHDTHVGVVLKLIEAIRRLPLSAQPQKLVGCEVWRDLDWLCDKDKVVMDVSGHDELADSLLAVFDSQIAGGKRYDLATRGRRLANATYFESHATDKAAALIFGMDLTPLILDNNLEPEMLFERYLVAFRDEVKDRLKRLR